MPMSSIERTTPSAARVTPHSRAMPGEANAMERTSKPSMALSRTVIATTANCAVVILDWSMISRGSVIGK